MANIKILDLTGRIIPGSGIELIQKSSSSQTQGTGSVYKLNSFGEIVLPDEDLTTDFFYRAFAPGYEEQYSGAEFLQNGSILTLDVYSNPGKWVVLAAAAATVLVLAKKRKKKVGFLKNVPPIVQGGIVLGGLGIIAYLILKGTNKDKLLPGAAQSRLKELQGKGIYPTISDVQAESFASMLVNAFDDCGTDEAAVKHVFGELNNEADLMLLIQTYGTRTYTGCFEGSLFTDFTANLSQSMTAELSESELQEVSAILQSKNINYSF